MQTSEVVGLDKAGSATGPHATVAATLNSEAIPMFVRRSDRLSDAWRFACDAYDGHPTKTLAHPVAVAALMDQAGYPEHVVVAALLHDVIEDTSRGLDELSGRFGAEVCALVARLTEDDGVGRYPDRKAELRGRAAASHSDDAAAIFAADKLASTRALNEQNAQIERAKLEHYERTVRDVREHHHHVPFLEELSHQLQRLRERVAS